MRKCFKSAGFRRKRRKQRISQIAFERLRQKALQAHNVPVGVRPNLDEGGIDAVERSSAH
jgi:hypothetical protein